LSLFIFPDSKRSKNEVRLSEKDCDLILSMPLNTGLFFYKSGENEISAFRAQRASMNVYHPTICNNKQNNKKTAQANYALVKALVVTGFGLFLLLLGAR
jgi:hypothetical protein